MSDISILSGRYDTVSKFSSKLNEAVLLLRKAALKAKLPATRLSERSATDHAEEFLGRLLGALIETPDGHFPADATIPHSFFDDFSKLRQHEAGFNQKLKDIQDRLTHFRDLTEEDFEVFDKLLSVAEADVSAVFNKLWRKR